MANNIRDLESDRAVGKRTLAVMAGRARSRAIYAWLLLFPFAMIAVAAGLGWTPVLTGSAILFLPLARPLVATVYRESNAAQLIPVLAGTARLQLLVALAISAARAHRIRHYVSCHCCQVLLATHLPVVKASLPYRCSLSQPNTNTPRCQVFH
jgi:1,4-dihydroxy-2-naphthoate octaprenyltransferase